MRLSEAPIDVWMQLDDEVDADPQLRYQARRRRDGWFEFRWNSHVGSVFSMGVLSWEDHDWWLPIN